MGEAHPPTHSPAGQANANPDKGRGAGPQGRGGEAPERRGLIIYDLDGTLVDSRHDLAEAGNGARAAIGLPPMDVEEIVGFLGDGVWKLIERLTPACDDGQRMRAYQAYMPAYAACCTHRTRAFPGVPELVAAVRAAGWKQAVATNKPLEFTTAILTATGLASFMEGVQGGDGPKKPDPGQLLSLMHAGGHDPGGTVMVGDHHTDLLAAQAAGCRAIWCSWGFGWHDGAPRMGEARTPADVLALLTQ